MYYISCFVIYSILGYIFETILFFIFNINIESGFLLGPWTIIYGFGFLIVNYLFCLIKKKFNNKYLIYILLFIISTFSLSLVELIGGLLLENFFGVIWWNYDNYFLHIGKYICIWISFIWGFLAIINIIVFKPFFDILIKLIPRNYFILLFFILLIDFILSTILHIIL